RVCSGIQFSCNLIFTDYHDLLMGTSKHAGSDGIGCGKDAVLPRNPREQFEGLLGLVAMPTVVGVGIHANQRDRRHRISGGRGGVLEGFTGSGKHAQGSCSGLTVEEAATLFIVEAL